MAKKKESTGIIKVDTAAGSRSFNRLEMQVSQTLHMAIELYDSLNYLFILDHYDDITLFDLDAEPLAVSYYQLKTSEGTITIDSAITENWIAKLYAQLSRPEGWLVKELGLITNVPLEVKYKIESEKKRKLDRTENLTAERTPFSNLNPVVQGRIRADIAEKFGIKLEEVDLSKFAHLRTTLSITSHRDLAEKEMSDFLYGKYPKITVETVKGIYAAMIELLSRRQSYETMPEAAEFEEVRKHKGVTRNDFNRVIDQAISISIPEYADVEYLLKPKEEDKARVSLAYVTIATDSNKRNNKSLYELFQMTQETVKDQPFDGSITVWEYCQEVAKSIKDKNPLLCAPYDGLYIPTLVTCLLINEARR